MPAGPRRWSGVSALVHTASPFPATQPKDPAVLIRPAVEGTERVLKAAAAAGVERVVLTSSTVAVLNEAKPDTLAGRGRLVRHQPADDHALCQVEDPGRTRGLGSGKVAGPEADHDQPGLVLGPPLDEHYGSSLGLIERIMKGKDPMLPGLGFPSVDVRDVAEMHLRALAAPRNGGQALYRDLRVDGDGRHGPHAEGGLSDAAHPHARGPRPSCSGSLRSSIRRSGRSCRRSGIWSGCRTPAR